MSIDIDKINRLLPDGYSCEMRESPVRLTFTTPDNLHVRIVPDQWESEEDIVGQVLPPPGTLDLRKIRAGLPTKGYTVEFAEGGERLVCTTPVGRFDIEPEEGDTEQDILHLLRMTAADVSHAPAPLEKEVAALKAELGHVKVCLRLLEIEVERLKERS
jgi:hypothetical protein